MLKLRILADPGLRVCVLTHIPASYDQVCVNLYSLRHERNIYSPGRLTNILASSEAKHRAPGGAREVGFVVGYKYCAPGGAREVDLRLAINIALLTESGRLDLSLAINIALLAERPFIVQHRKQSEPGADRGPRASSPRGVVVASGCLNQRSTLGAKR
ncbi:MAG TPA: hypothetical protein VNO50_19695 [Pyrinomonadaceae bacterium]|nr:hypothetical protein [Pyrinomonadaceae bacterium]